MISLSKIFSWIVGIPLWIVRIILWIVLLVISLIGSVLGLPIVAFLAFTHSWIDGVSALGKAIKVWKPAWAYLWSNDEDGVIPPAEIGGVPYLPGKSDAVRSFNWVGLRNKFSNLRFTKPFGFKVDPTKIKSIGNNHNLYEKLDSKVTNTQWSLTWQGLYSGLWIMKPGGRQFRIGWTLVPADADGFNELDLRQVWCGFSVQFNKA